MTLHGPALETYGSNQKQKWQYTAFGLVVSQKLLNYIRDKLAGYLPTKLAMAPMGVNLDNIKRENPYIPWESGECRLFSCGRLNPVKGHNYLIDVVAQLQSRGWRVHLEIAGEDEQGGSGYHQDLDQMITAKGLTDSIVLLGAVSEERIRQGLEAAHVFVLASLNEGIPVAVMEAMAMAMPVVVTDVGGNAELIDHGVDGILVMAEQTEQMVTEIERILRDRTLANQLSQASRQKIADHFHHRRSAEMLAYYLTNTVKP
jgi:glycosyltransferase involved in cell wall biosynthesis